MFLHSLDLTDWPHFLESPLWFLTWRCWELYPSFGPQYQVSSKKLEQTAPDGWWSPCAGLPIWVWPIWRIRYLTEWAHRWLRWFDRRCGMHWTKLGNPAVSNQQPTHNQIDPPVQVNSGHPSSWVGVVHQPGDQSPVWVGKPVVKVDDGINFCMGNWSI